MTVPGNDRIGNRLLKELAAVLVMPVSIVCRRMLNEGVWPQAWQTHFLIPIYTQSSVYMPKNFAVCISLHAFRRLWNMRSEILWLASCSSEASARVNGHFASSVPM